MVSPPKDPNSIALPPLTLRPKVLSHVLQRLRQNGPTSSTLLADLTLALRLLIASSSPARDLLPLSIVLYLNNTGKNLPLPVLLYTTLAYPSHPLGPLWDAQLDRQPEIEDTIRSEVIPGLISRLQLDPGLGTLHAAANTLLVLSRASESLLALILSEADYILPAIRAAYDALEQPVKGQGQEKETVKVKSDVLALCMALLGAVQSEGVKGGLRRLMGGGGFRTEEGGLFKQSLGQGVEMLEKGDVDGEAKRMLGEIRDERAREDPVCPETPADPLLCIGYSVDVMMRLIIIEGSIYLGSLPCFTAAPVARWTTSPKPSTTSVRIERTADPSSIARRSSCAPPRSYSIRWQLPPCRA